MVIVGFEVVVLGVLASLYVAGYEAWRFGKFQLFDCPSDVRSDQTFRIPLVDLSKYRHANSLSEKRKTADEIVNGFKEVGFIYLAGHRHPTEHGGQCPLNQSADFFRLPTSVKDELAWKDPRANRGYVKIGRERTTQSTDAAVIAELRSKAPDTKESMEIGRDWDKTWRNPLAAGKRRPRIQADDAGFFSSMRQTCHEVHTVIMRAIALGLDLDEKFFDDKINEQYHNLRLLSYPAIKTSLLKKEGQARAGAHSDYGSLTLLFQDNIGGLQVENPHTKHFQHAKPIPGTIVVNAGDLLARWSNDTLRSTLHRVVAPLAESANADESGMTPLRQSIAFFCNPNGGARISCLPSCHWPGNEAKYPPTTTEEYIVSRLSDTYN
ncbi:Clavaminate synthase-like protein [Russula earlei]|uniref:Clavaminate synthase-like protein n=1 Tax=Russula earlei TaxID=71964 RepID=A0ACC0UP48_9AGAM|nr:Clavaminate synthase-like protein [Russula earlei]